MLVGKKRFFPRFFRKSVAAMRRCNFRGQASENEKFILRVLLFN